MPHVVTTLLGGTPNRVAKFNGPYSIGNSAIWESGGNVGIGTTSPSSPLTVNSSSESPVASIANYGVGDGLDAVATNSPGTQLSAPGGYGVFGTGPGAGVYGHGVGDGGVGVWGDSETTAGVLGTTDTDGTAAVWAQVDVEQPNHAMALFAVNVLGEAGLFEGNVRVEGHLSTPAGSFKIDHPLDPSNKYLYHSFVESPDMKNIYDGTVTTNASGVAIVSLPGYFSALNRDFRYQLTVIGQFAQAIVAGELENNQFTIRTDKPNVKVSWQVTGIRQDAWANAHRIPVEVEKPEKEIGTYLHPEFYNEPNDKSVFVALMSQQMKAVEAAGRRHARPQQ
jgi:hypothetical protein